MKQVRRDGIVQRFPQTRLGIEQRRKAKLTAAMMDLKGNWRSLSKAERARYTPEYVAAQLKKANIPSAGMSPEELDLS